MPELIDVARVREGLRAGQKPAGAVWRLATVEPFADVDSSRRIPFCLSDGTVDRMGDTIAADGWVLDGYQKNPVVLWAHDASSPPIGRGINIRVSDERLLGEVEFAGAEVYDFADLIFRLVKAKYVNAGSVGFMPLDLEFSNDKGRPWGIDFTRQELLEFSVVPVPANANALVEARAKGIDTRPLAEWAERVLDGGGRVIVPKTELERLRRLAQEPRRRGGAAADWKCGAARDLALDDSDAWDGGAAAASIFEYAGGDDFDPAKARRGFLLYDAAAPKLRGSYKDPFAHVAGGELKAVKGGIRAAASRLPQTDAPQEALDAAEIVVKHYEEKFGMAGDKNLRPGAHARADGGGMGEGDPSTGGYLANCGRGLDSECGLKNPEECMVHGPSTADKALAGAVARAVGAELRRELAPLVARGMPDDGADDHLDRAMEHVRAAHGHAKDLADGDGPKGKMRDEAICAMHAHVKAADGYMEKCRSLMADGGDDGKRTVEDIEARAARVAALAA